MTVRTGKNNILPLERCKAEKNFSPLKEQSWGWFRAPLALMTTFELNVILSQCPERKSRGGVGQ
jgi:hypothetical protein